jgi:hypothetical protein
LPSLLQKGITFLRNFKTHDPFNPVSIEQGVKQLTPSIKFSSWNICFFELSRQSAKQLTPGLRNKLLGINEQAGNLQFIPKIGTSTSWQYLSFLMSMQFDP